MMWLRVAVILAAGVTIACRGSRTEASPASERPSESVPPAGQSSALAVRLFADDVAMDKRLPLSLSVETLGGVSTNLIPRGTGLPTSRRETFSTATDNQGSIEVHVLVGDRTLAVDNVTVGKFSIAEIPPAARGGPKFEVAFAVDEHGTFRFSAKDVTTGRSQPVSSASPLPNPLPAARVARMLDDAKAEEAKGEYGIAPGAADDRDSRSVTLYTKQLRERVESTRTALKSGSTIPEAARRRCEDELKRADRVLATNARPDRASVKHDALKADELEKVLRSLGEAAKQCR